MFGTPAGPCAEEGIEHAGSIDGLRLLTPLQRQWCRNELETELLIQIAFSRRVSEVVTQPIIEIGGQRIAPSMAIRLYTDLDDRPLVHVVEVDAGDGRIDDGIVAAGRAWCEENGGGHHVLTEGAIRTTMLANARLLTPYVGLWPMDEDLDAIDRTMKANAAGTCTVAEAVDAIVATGVEPDLAAAAVRQVVANWVFECDLSQPYDPASTLEPLDRSSYLDSAKDPFLKFLDPIRERDDVIRSSA